MRFLMSRRWALFALAVVLLAYLAWILGQWQFHRLEDRKERNTVIEQNEQRAPAPVQDVLAVGETVGTSDEWRQVTATGTYAVEDTVIVRYRTREGESGINVVVPLETADGTALLVDRGWVPADNRGTSTGDVPEPPAGEVTVNGWVRADAEGRGTTVTEQSTRAISSSTIGEALDRELYGGFVVLASETPEAATPLLGVDLPEINNGPHFFYGLQWWFFGALAIFGFFYLMYDEWRKARADEPNARQRARSMPPSTGSMTPFTNEAAGESRKAAARPNSSGSP